MFNFFADPYPDELMYNMYARYHKYSGDSIYSTISTLSGHEKNSVPFFIANNLDYLCTQFENSIYKPEYFIYNHTIFPFYSLFQSEKERKYCIDGMRSKNGSLAYSRLGILKECPYKQSVLMYCPDCMKEDRRKYREAFWHRKHQVPGCFICSTHKKILGEYYVDTKNSSVKLHCLEDCELNYNPSHIDIHLFRELLNFSKDIEYIFHNDFEDYDSEIIHQKVRIALMYKDLISIKGIVNQAKLFKCFNEYYSKEFLEKLNISISNFDSGNWLRSVTRNRNRHINPLKYLILLRFLFGSVAELFSIKETQYIPFGEGPWPCLNPMAHHFKQDVIEACTIIRERRLGCIPIGIFECTCGFIYSRRGPDKIVDDRFRYNRVKQFGWLWDSKLKENVLNGISNINELSKIMKCDKETVMRHATILGISEYIKSKLKIELSNNPNKASQEENNEELYKDQILEILESQPNITRTEIKKHFKKQYTWLIVEQRIACRLKSK